LLKDEKIFSVSRVSEGKGRGEGENYLNGGEGLFCRSSAI
jgi:hypothetical protein